MTRLAFLLALLTSWSAYGADVLVLRSEVAEFADLGAKIENLVKRDYALETIIVPKSVSFEEFQGKIKGSAAKVVIVMDNHAMELLRKYFEKNPESKLRGVAAMGVNLKDILARNKYIAGVSYEIAGYLAIKGYSAATQSRPKKILGIYRSGLSKVFAEEARMQLAREKISLELADIEGIADEDLARNLQDRIEKIQPDALWLVNDNRIINGKMLSTIWLAVARKQRVPLICGIQKLARELGICVYTETPTLSGTAQKIADIIYGYIADENDADFYGVEYIQETERTVNRFLLEGMGKKLTGSTDDFEIYTGEIKGL